MAIYPKKNERPQRVLGLRWRLAASFTVATGAALLFVFSVSEILIFASRRAAQDDPASRIPWSDMGLRLLQGLPGTALLLLPVALVIGTVLGMLTSRGLVNRLWALSVAAESWSTGDLQARVGDRTGDELGELARRLDGMAVRLDAHLLTRQELAAVEERNRLARELHDSVKQQVFSLSLFLATVDTLMENDPDQARRQLGEARAVTGATLRELNALILHLRPAALDGQGLAPALREYVNAWSHQTGIEARLRVRGDRPFELELEQGLFRVAQEALANVARHSGARKVDVHLAIDDDRTDADVRLSIRDDGRGFDPASPSRGYGLIAMEERLRGLGGDLEIHSEQGRGTTVVVRWSTKVGNQGNP